MKWSWAKTYKRILQLAPGQWRGRCLADLAGVVECRPVGSYVHLKFLHASLPDFLQDNTRSGIYYLNSGLIHGLDEQGQPRETLLMSWGRGKPEAPLEFGWNKENLVRFGSWHTRAGLRQTNIRRR